MDDFDQAIGEFITAFGHLEGTLHWCLRVILNVTIKDEIAIVDAIRSFGTRLQLFEALMFNRLDKAPFESFKADIITPINNLNTFRNDLVHHSWAGYVRFPPDKEYFLEKVRRPGKAGASPISKRFSVPQIVDKTIECWNVHGELGLLIRKLFVEPDEERLRSSRGKSAQPNYYS